MKKILTAVLFGVASMFSINHASAQISLSVNIGSQPLWGPTGYDHVDYYYLPEVDAYYYVPGNQYVYLVNGAWVRRSTLPAKYRNVDLYRTYKVVMNGDRPYLNHKVNYNKYRNYRTAYNKQSPIRDSRDKKYDVVRNRPNVARPQNQVGRPNQNQVSRPNRQEQARPVRNENNGKGNENHGRPERGEGKDQNGKH